MNSKGFPEEVQVFKNRKEWRDWLAVHHQSETLVWLLIQKVHSQKTGIRLAEAVEEALCYGWIDGQMYRLDDEQFVIRLTPRRRKSIWSKRNKTRAEELIAAGQMTEAGLAAIREAKASGRWQAAH